MTEEFSTLQDFPLQASIEAVKASVNFESYDDFYRHMIEHLPQNSPQTRRRYAGLIGRRYFPRLSLDSLPAKAWRTYHDEQILMDLMRVFALESEPAIAQFLVDKIWLLDTGHIFDSSLARVFIEDTYGTFKYQSYKRLLATLRELGFLGRYNGELVVEQPPLPADALLILIHDRLAPTPRIVRLSDILATQWWRFLGFKQPEDVRQVLRQAADAGLIARYSVVDELEQVTTRFSRDEYIGQAKQL